MVRKSLLLILALAGIASADTGFTSTIKVTETDNSPSCIAGQVKVQPGQLTCSGQTATLNITGGSGGSSSLAVTVGVARSSPTSDVIFNPNQFSGSVTSSSMTVSLAASSVTLQGQNVIFKTETLQSGATFYTSSGSVNTFLIPSISSGQCLQSGTGGLVTGTGSACGSGSGAGDNLGDHISTKTLTANYGVVTTTVTGSSFLATTSSFTVLGADGLRSNYGLSTSTFNMRNCGSVYRLLHVNNASTGEIACATSPLWDTSSTIFEIYNTAGGVYPLSMYQNSGGATNWQGFYFANVLQGSFGMSSNGDEFMWRMDAATKATLNTDGVLALTGAAPDVTVGGTSVCLENGTNCFAFGDMLLASTQTVTGRKIFQSSTTFEGSVWISSTILLSGSPGTASQALLSGGNGAAPTWGTPSASAGGNSGQIQYNNATALAGIPGSNIGTSSITLSTGGVGHLEVFTSTLNVKSSFTITGISALVTNSSVTFQATSPAQITANQNDYALGMGAFFRLSSDAQRNITGFAGGADGRLIFVSNVGSFNIVITNQDAASVAGNRIITGFGTSYVLAPDDSVMFIYDNTTQRWRLVE